MPGNQNDTKEIDDGPKRNKKLVKTRKTKNITTSDNIGQKQKTRNQSLPGESENEPKDNKPSKKYLPKPKVVKQCEKPNENKDSKEKETSGRKIKKNNSRFQNSESEKNSDEGTQKKRTKTAK